MASYTNLANSLTKDYNNLNSDCTNINSLLTTLKGTFIGASSTKLSNDITNCITDLKTQSEAISSLVKTLNLIEEHTNEVKTLNGYKADKNSYKADINNPNQSNPYTEKVNEWNQKVTKTEKDIQSNLPKVSRIANSITLINTTIDYSYKDYTKSASANISGISGLKIYSSVTCQDLLNEASTEWIVGFKNNAYNLRNSTLASGGYTAQEVDDIINARMVGASPREKAIIAALSVIELGIDKGIESSYQLSRTFFNSVSKPYDTNALVTHGADCASYVSWALNKSSDTDFNNATLETIRNQGVKTNYDNLQPGDIVYSPSHVAMVIENKDGKIILADASHVDNDGYPKGIRLQKVSYNVLKNNYFDGYNMDRFYAQSA